MINDLESEKKKTPMHNYRLFLPTGFLLLSLSLARSLDLSEHAVLVVVLVPLRLFRLLIIIILVLAMLFCLRVIADFFHSSKKNSPLAMLVFG